MGRKKKNTQGDDETKEKDKEEEAKAEEYFDSSEEEVVQRRQYDIESDIQELAYAFNLGGDLIQKLNDVMIEERQKTWGEDIEKLYEILKEARTPAAMLNIKIKDMEKGRFIGKAKCGPKVKALARKHHLDKGASTKLEDAMSMREAMGKDIDKDIAMLDEHLAASNKPSALVSQKLESLRKGFNIGHCIYSREVIVPGGHAPGIEGCFDKKQKRTPGLGLSDIDLKERFKDSSGSGGGGKLMDEAEVKRMMAAAKKKDQAAQTKERGRDRSNEKDRSGKEKDRKRKRSNSRGSSHSRGRKRGRSKSRKAKGRSASRKGRSRR